MKTVNMKKITVEEKNRINKKKNSNDAAEEIICQMSRLSTLRR